MVTLDRIRLTGLLRRKPWKRGFFYAAIRRSSLRRSGSVEAFGSPNLRFLALPVWEQLQLAGDRPARERDEAMDAVGVRDHGDAVEGARMGEPEHGVLQPSSGGVAGEAFV